MIFSKLHISFLKRGNQKEEFSKQYMTYLERNARGVIQASIFIMTYLERQCKLESSTLSMANKGSCTSKCFTLIKNNTA
jgi:hypothetical protein